MLWLRLFGSRMCPLIIRIICDAVCFLTYFMSMKMHLSTNLINFYMHLALPIPFALFVVNISSWAMRSTRAYLFINIYIDFCFCFCSLLMSLCCVISYYIFFFFLLSLILFHVMNIYDCQVFLYGSFEWPINDGSTIFVSKHRSECWLVKRLSVFVSFSFFSSLFWIYLSFFLQYMVCLVFVFV